MSDNNDNVSCLEVVIGQPCCCRMLFPLQMTSPWLLYQLKLWSQAEDRMCHHAHEDGLEASLLFHPHQTQLMSCGIMDQPNHIGKKYASASFFMINM